MANIRAFDQPAIYEIRVQGTLNQPWSDWFDGFTITPLAEDETVLGRAAGGPEVRVLLFGETGTMVPALSAKSHRIVRWMSGDRQAIGVTMDRVVGNGRRAMDG